MKGIILAGGSGTRLHPITLGISKQLMPIYDKPMIYYPLSTLMMAGIREVLIITTPDDQAQFVRLLGDGSQWGIDLTYAVQPSPDGLAQAFVIGADFIGDDSVALVLGDNIFYGTGLGTALQTHTTPERRPHLRLPRDRALGVRRRRVRATTAPCCRSRRSPRSPKSSYAVPGLYFYDNDVVADRPRAGAQRPRRAGDHRRQRRLPAARRPQRDGARPAARRGSTPGRSRD